MTRADITDKLIHFTKSIDGRSPLENLLRIIADRRLHGGTEWIRGGYCCICFTEAPADMLQGGFVGKYSCSRYSAFGLMVSKSLLFESGGRPVIYQSDAEFDQLPPSHRWRHVRYEPTNDAPIDFTWEREWRIQISELLLDEQNWSIVVPNAQAIEELKTQHSSWQDWQEYVYSHCVGVEQAKMYREDFKWRVTSLGL